MALKAVETANTKIQDLKKICKAFTVAGWWFVCKVMIGKWVIMGRSNNNIIYFTLTIHQLDCLEVHIIIFIITGNNPWL